MPAAITLLPIVGVVNIVARDIEMVRFACVIDIVPGVDVFEL